MLQKERKESSKWNRNSRDRVFPSFLYWTYLAPNVKCFMFVYANGDII